MKTILLSLLFLIPLITKGDDSLYYPLPKETIKIEKNVDIVCFNHIGYFNKKLTKLKSSKRDSSCVTISENYIIYQTMYEKQDFMVLKAENHDEVIHVLLYSNKIQDFIVMIIDTKNKLISFGFKKPIVLFNKSD